MYYNYSMLKLNNDWDNVLKDLIASENYQAVRRFLAEEYRSQTVYPSAEQLFSAFRCTPYSSVSVVILGQDPYHRQGQAHGMSFSVPRGVDVPPSLKNIYKELYTDLGCQIPSHGSLCQWAEQGVLLLNSILSVREGQALSHARCGWEAFTDEVIALIAQKPDPVVFMLWGAFARSKAKIVSANSSSHLILESAHPSPLSSYRFFGCKHFSKANSFLTSVGKQPINWQISD